ncbi:hypothetical protein CVT25_003783 [Psilocybe cyanescens]|uniref:Uncharacterized protein n=1 Tax=Psilocybe cyanescens TaxID=93625 RepID=A0A409XTQ9_PSICY|nr:hypothetical protein CVT25_003783 [Psilocybe cyanescens]
MLVHPTTAPPDHDSPWFQPPSPTPPPVPSVDLLAAPKIPISIPGADLDCPMCNIYQKMAADLYQMNVDAVRHNRELFLLAETESALCERRVAGFHKLHEAAILKETPSVPARDTETAPAPALHSLACSHWTWGVEEHGLLNSRDNVLESIGNMSGSVRAAHMPRGQSRNALVNMSNDKEVEIVPPPSAQAQVTLANMSDNEVEILSAAPAPRSLSRAALANISDDDEVENISSSNVNQTQATARAQLALANMSDDDEVEILSTAPAPRSLSWAALNNMSDDGGVEIVSLSNVGLTASNALNNMLDNSNIQFRACATLENMSNDSPNDSPAPSPSLTHTHAHAALDNMSDDNEPISSPADSRSHAPIALDNMLSDDDKPNPPAELISPLTDSRSHARIELANMLSDDDEPNPPTAPGPYAHPTLNALALYLDPSRCPPRPAPPCPCPCQHDVRSR